MPLGGLVLTMSFLSPAKTDVTPVAVTCVLSMRGCEAFDKGGGVDRLSSKTVG
jgi:hypothetical protein